MSTDQDIIGKIEDLEERVQSLETASRPAARPPSLYEFTNPDDREMWAIVLDEVVELEERGLPFIGLSMFKETKFPKLFGAIPRETVNRITKTLIKEGYLDVEYVDNPNNADRPTAAIRPTDAGYELADELEELEAVG